MATSAKFCSKCKTSNDHYTKDCDNEWPIWSAQWCDRCGSASHETIKCSKDKVEPACVHCGHEGHHKSRDCRLKWDVSENDAENERRMTHWTNKKYEDKVEALKLLRAAAGRLTASNKTTKGAQKKSKTQNNPGTSAVSTTSTPNKSKVTFEEDVLNRLPKLPIKEDQKYSASVLSEEPSDKDKWAALNLDLAPFSSSGLANAKNKDVAANFFKVDFEVDKLEIRKYRINLGSIKVLDSNGKPKVVRTTRETKRFLIEQLFEQRPPTAEVWTSDYASHIISVGNLYEDFNSSVVDSAYVVPHLRKGRPNQGNQVVSTTIIYEGTLRLEDLTNYVDSSKERVSGYFPDEDLRILNLISWAGINKTDFAGVCAGNKFFPNVQAKTASLDLPYSRDGADGAVQLKDILKSPDRLTTKPGPKVYLVRTGFFSSVRPGNDSILLNVNATTSVFYPGMNLQQWIRIRCPQSITKAVNKELVGLTVTFDGDDEKDRKGKKRTICSFSNQKISAQTFKLKGKDTTVLEHLNATYLKYKEKAHQLDPNALCVNLGSADETKWYPADKLTLVERQVVRKQLDDAYKPLMLHIATRSPEQNRSLIKDYALSHLGMFPDKESSTTEYAKYGIKISPEFVSVSRRALEQVPLLFGKKTIAGKNRRGNASWDMRDVIKGPGFHTVRDKIDTLHIILVYPENEKTGGKWIEETFAKSFLATMRPYGFTANEVKVESVAAPARQESRGDLARKLTGALEALETPTFVLVRLPPSSVWGESLKRIYSDIKWWGDCDHGVANVCVTAEKLWQAPAGYKYPHTTSKFEAKEDVGLMGNLCLKINIKTKGTNHCVEKLGLLPNTMVVGADVTHPGGDVDETCPSMAGVVATTDVHCAQYLASARLQPNKTEFIQDLRGMIYERLRKYHERNNKFPAHILFYRDGVSESQYGMVRTQELPQITKACSAILQSTLGSAWEMPSVTLLIVGKRHHARFYPKTEPNGKFKNLPSGTVIDTEIVAPKQFNFYLQSHDSPLGTARSSHYVVLENGSNYTAGKLQEITNNLCFMGSRAMHGLSVCTPAAYADILCDRLRMYMKPVLDNINLVPKPTNEGQDFRQQAVHHYEKELHVWGEKRSGSADNGQGRKNPWHPDVDDIMFYL